MKVAIIGAGNVGATLAYTLLVRDIVTRVSLIDVSREKAVGEVLDLAHGASYLENPEIRAEGYEGVADADVIVLAAGRGRSRGSPGSTSRAATPRSPRRSWPTWPRTTAAPSSSSSPTRWTCSLT